MNPYFNNQSFASSPSKTTPFYFSFTYMVKLVFCLFFFILHFSVVHLDDRSHLTGRTVEVGYKLGIKHTTNTHTPTPEAYVDSHYSILNFSKQSESNSVAMDFFPRWR